MKLKQTNLDLFSDFSIKNLLDLPVESKTKNIQKQLYFITYNYPYKTREKLSQKKKRFKKETF